MQEFILKRNEDGTNETTAVDQALIKIFKDRPTVMAAISAGILKEGEMFGTIDDDHLNDNLQDQVREMQEEIRELQESGSEIRNLLPEDVSSDNLLETVQGVLKSIQALDYAERGGDNKYIKSISETDGIINATVGTIDTTTSTTSTNPVTNGAITSLVESRSTTLTNDINDEVTRATNAESGLDTRIQAIEDDYLTSTDQINLQNAIDAVDNSLAQEITDRNTAINSAINTEVTNRNTAITNAINGLDKSDSAVSGKYVSAVSETNGVISVTRNDLPSVPQMSLSGTTLTITLS